MLTHFTVWTCLFYDAAARGVAQTQVCLLVHVGDSGAPRYIQDQSTDGFVCIRYVEESQFTAAGPDWLKFVMKTVIPKKSTILDIYGESGKTFSHNGYDGL